jgi:TatA/E family protein of Tat protein translocase
LGVPEVILIFVVALLLFGPRKMPQIGRSVGRALGEFRRASNDFKRTIEDEVAAEEVRSVERDLKEIRDVGREVLKDAESVPGTEPDSEATPSAGTEEQDPT